MGYRPGRIGKKKNIARGLTRKDAKRMVITGAVVLGLALAAALTLYLARPKLLWYVDESLAANWARVLQTGSPPVSRYAVLPRQGGEPFPRGRFGFVISRNGPEGERAEGVPIALYRDLSRAQAYDGWVPLALDPWMVFRKHYDPEPSRSFIENGNERGSILIAGLDQGAVSAWLCQLLQERPGVFVQDEGQWKEKSGTLARDYPFQNGAFAYTWVQVWPLLFREGVSWLYAPLSQARTQPSYRIGLLGATRFPDPPGWDRYGMQADVLWAKMQGSGKQREKIAAVDEWLKDPKTQTLIANMFQWIPAHPSGKPYNTVSWESQMAWLRSSFIWQGADDAQDS